MRFPFTFLMLALPSLTIQGVLLYTYFLDNTFLDRSEIFHLGIMSTAIAAIALVLYRVLATAEERRWSLLFLFCVLVQLGAFGGGIWFTWSAWIGEPLTTLPLP